MCEETVFVYSVSLLCGLDMLVLTCRLAACGGLWVGVYL